MHLSDIAQQHRAERQLCDRLAPAVGANYAIWLIANGPVIGGETSFEAVSVVDAFAAWEARPSGQTVSELQLAVDDYCRSNPERPIS